MSRIIGNEGDGTRLALRWLSIYHPYGQLDITWKRRTLSSVTNCIIVYNHVFILLIRNIFSTSWDSYLAIPHKGLVLQTKSHPLVYFSHRSQYHPPSNTRNLIKKEWPWRNTSFTSKQNRPHKCLVAKAYSNSIHVCRLGIKSVVTSMMFRQEDIHEWHYSDRRRAHWNIDRESLILPLLVFRISTGMDNPLCSRRNEKIASNLKVEELLNKKTYPFQSPQNDRIRGLAEGNWQGLKLSLL